MALDKLVDSAQLDADLTTVADAIRTKGGTSAPLAFPDGMAQAIDDIETGITPSGTINITDTNVTDVTNYATAQVVDADLIASNIKKDVNILGVVGSYEGGGGNKVTGTWIPVNNTRTFDHSFSRVSNMRLLYTQSAITPQFSARTQLHRDTPLP